MMKILKNTLNYEDQQTSVMYFLPDVNDGLKPVFALLGHGYTSDKSSLLNWAIRLCESGVSCALFDWPGHYLGNYSEVHDFEYFKNHVHELFQDAFMGLSHEFSEEFPMHQYFLEKNECKILLSGHSMGALLGLKAMMLPFFGDFQKYAIGVGIGHAPVDKVHLFDSPFYKSTLNVRQQLVSPALHPDQVFPWIKEEKLHLEIRDCDMHFISGDDDLVVGSDGMERLSELLISQNNRVTMEKPSKLPHHEPQLAAAYIKKQLKKIAWI
jgi:hypothetical protein